MPEDVAASADTILSTGAATDTGAAPSDSGASAAAAPAADGRARGPDGKFAPKAGDAAADKPLAAGGGTDKPVATVATWVEDWRARMAGEDKARLKTLERMGSPEDVAKAYFEAQKKISEGFKAPALPDSPTDEQVAEYRKALGIPEKPEDYKLSDLPKGVVLGEAEKPIVDSFAKSAHAANMPPQYAKAAAAWYFEERDRQQQAVEASPTTITRPPRTTSSARSGGRNTAPTSTPSRISYHRRRRDCRTGFSPDASRMGARSVTTPPS
jgi:hypothetical protein